MVQAIRFGGPGASPTPSGVVGPWPPQGPGGVEFMVQDFFHYLGKIWLDRQNHTPQDAHELSSFKLAPVIAAYRAYRSAGHQVPLDEGLDLEQSYLVTQLVARRPLTCLLNAEMSELATPKMARVRILSATDLVAEVGRRFKVEIDTNRDVAGQLQRWGSLAPFFVALVFDGETGHCILLRGVERRTGRLIYWDPWPLRSLLCIESNKAGVSAQLVPSGEFFWTLDPDSMTRVLCAVFTAA